MTRPPSSASEWTSAVEAAVQAELLRRSRLLKWAVGLSLVVGATAVAMAVALRGMTWDELMPRLRQQMAPVLATQVAQGEATLALQDEIGRLEAELRRIEAELRGRMATPDPAVQALQRRVQALERRLSELAAPPPQPGGAAAPGDGTRPPAAGAPAH